MVTVYINEEECIGCESCTEIFPEVFRFDAETETVKVAKHPTVPLHILEDAAESCPQQCIHLV